MATLLRNIFAKPVDRSIDGVIKADDKASLLTELDEYVIHPAPTRKDQKRHDQKTPLEPPNQSRLN